MLKKHPLILRRGWMNALNGQQKIMGKMVRIIDFYSIFVQIYQLQSKMNIENLLKRLEERREKKRETNSSISSERYTRKSNEDSDLNNISIGMVNALPNTQNNKSYFKQYFEDFVDDTQSLDQVQLIEHNSIQTTDKLQRIESELGDIQKMKSLFEKKKKVQNHGSNDRNTNNKSVQKHYLKPSQIPKFKQTSQFQANFTVKQPGYSYTFKDQSFSNLNRVDDINLKQDLFDDSKKSISLNNNQIWGQKSQQQTNSNIKCGCEDSLKDFMSQVNQKMGFLAMKVSQLEDKNMNLHKKHQKAVSNNIKAMQMLKKLDEEKQQLLQTEQKWTKSKIELQNILKQIVSRKQKDKYKQNMNKEDAQNYFKNKEKTKEPTKPTIPLDDKKSNKNKVQNLLQRLQLRVQKS